MIVFVIMAAAVFGLIIGGTLGSAKRCDFCDDCAYKRFYIDYITGEGCSFSQKTL